MTNRTATFDNMEFFCHLIDSFWIDYRRGGRGGNNE